MQALIKKLKNLRTRSLFLFVLFGVSTFATQFVSLPIAQADSEQLSWVDSFNIEMSGGNLSSSATITVDEAHWQDDGYYYFRATLASDSGDCTLGIRAFWTDPENDPQHLTLYAPPPGDVLSPPGSVRTCSSSDTFGDKDLGDLYQNIILTIGNVRPSDETTPETHAQQAAPVHVCSYLENSPNQLRVTVKKGGVTKSFTATNSVTGDPAPVTDINDDGPINPDAGCYGVYDGTFFLSPGDWKVCATVQGKTGCETINKQKYRPAQTTIVSIGQAPEAPFKTIVEAIVIIRNPDIVSLTEDQPFGTYNLQLKNSGGKVIKKGSVDVKYDSTPCRAAQEAAGEAGTTYTCDVGEDAVSGYMEFSNVPPGKYKLCIADTTKCVGLTKKYDERSRNNKIILSMSEAKKYDESGVFKTDSDSSCAIDNIGWIVCPVIKFMARIVDSTYGLVEKLLTIEPITTQGTGSSLYEAWGYMRNIANVAFVLAFLIIIYSQITGAGLNNYGIKKMLPKLIVAAILVNVSYWLCAIAVDLSNIAGASIKSLFDNIQTISTPQFNEGAFSDNTGTGWEGIAGFILAAGATAAVTAILGVSVLLPALIAAVVAIVTVFLVLTLRQALIILLIVISPLAFVALLLPNTEDWFKKWRGLFQTLLLMFPIIATIFGASALASEIVMKSSGDFAVQIMGALIGILPLALTPIVMKTAGGVLNRFGAIVNNPNKGPFDRMRKGADKIRENSQVSRGLRAMDPNKRSFPGRSRFINYRNKRNAINSGRAEQLGDLQKEQIANRAVGDEKFAQQVAGNRAGIYKQKQESYLASVDPAKLEFEIDKSQVDNMVSTLTLGVKDPANKIGEMQKVLSDAVEKGDVTRARAAQEILMKSGNKGIDKLRESLQSVDQTSEVGVNLRKDIASSDLKGKAADVYAWSVDGKQSLGDVSASSSTWAGLSDAQVAGQVSGAMQAAVASNGISPEKARSTLDSRGSEAIGEAEKKILTDHAAAAPTRPTGP